MAYPPSTYPAEQQTLPLRHGDKLGSAEFLRRYELMPDDFRAELINGTVQLHTQQDGSAVSPISGEGHSFPQAKIIYWLESYALATAGVRSGGPATLVLPKTNSVVEPDALLLLDEAHGGRTTVGNDGLLHGIPELVVEIQHKGTSLTDKLEIYRANEVPELLVWDTQQNAVVWYARYPSAGYHTIDADPQGVLRSRQFPGLWLAHSALLSRNMPEVVRVQQLGLTSPEHGQFVANLTGSAE